MGMAVFCEILSLNYAPGAFASEATAPGVYGPEARISWINTHSMLHDHI